MALDVISGSNTIVGGGSAGVTVAGAGTDDFANSLTDTSHPLGQVAGRGSATGSIETAGDRDWFQVPVSPGFTYTVNLQGVQGSGGTLADPILRLYDATGALLASNDDSAPGANHDSQLVFIASASTYYLEAGASGDQAIGTYRLSVTPTSIFTSPDDFANSLTDGAHPFGVITPGGTTAGNLEVVGDRDWFKVQLTAGTSYTASLFGLRDDGGILQDPYLRLHDAADALLAENDNVSAANHDSQLTFTPATSGTYYLEVGQSGDQDFGTYRIGLSSAADDFASSFSDPSHALGQIAAGSASTGTIEVTGDRDWFTVQLTRGQLYEINLQGAHGGGGTLADPYLRIADSTGALLIVNDNAQPRNPDAQFFFTAALGGTYYLVAGAAGDVGTGSYRLSVAPITLPTSGLAAPGRAPETSFDAGYYLAHNSDVAASGMDGQLHYDLFGWHEGRNPGPLFDTSWYLSHNPDVAAAGIDPLQHYESFGWKEGRDPGPNFVTASYLARNPDVAAVGMNPLDHYLLFGIAEHRAIGFQN